MKKAATPPEYIYGTPPGYVSKIESGGIYILSICSCKRLHEGFFPL